MKITPFNAVVRLSNALHSIIKKWKRESVCVCVSHVFSVAYSRWSAMKTPPNTVATFDGALASKEKRVGLDLLLIAEGTYFFLFFEESFFKNIKWKRERPLLGTTWQNRTSKPRGVLPPLEALLGNGGTPVGRRVPGNVPVQVPTSATHFPHGHDAGSHVLEYGQRRGSQRG